ncbi:3'-5' exonuclease [Nocardia cyriacigeorgica]|uniref:3'-5' exonuclease n=1 Tax=Nocardia cyriacigeorgica TaxID=135487 RepID=UPI00030453BF|nr:3'-5' exonuclease [Nocardia cyriacigeorgica]TLF57845.1 DNA helicase UvrD [Nocardia cyriacigeorgica]
MTNATVVLAANTKSMPKLDGSIKNKVYDFFEKVRADHTAPGLHIEPIKGAVDTRVRTGRVDLNFRAIMFRIDGKLGDTTYIYLGTWKHDVANKLAQQSTLRVNPVNGVLEGIVGELDGRDDRKKRSRVPDPTGALAELAVHSPVGYLAHVGFTAAELTGRLGLDPDLAERALAAPDQNGVLDVAQSTDVIWQQNALLELSVGRSIDEIRDTLGFTEQPVDQNLDDDEQVLAALDHPATKMQFTLVDDNDELRRVIEGGDFAAWRTFLHPNQRKFVEKDQRGAFRLSGGAGTGKTVVALHRARHLARLNPGARIVLTTFNKTLAQDLLANLRLLDPSITIADKPGDRGVYVAGLDKLAAAVLRQGGDLGPALESVFGAGDTTRRPRRVYNDDNAWAAAVREASPSLDPRLTHPSFLAGEYLGVVLGNRITTLEQYLKVPRAGRGVRLSRPQRSAIWQVIEQYRKQNRAKGAMTFPEAMAVAAAHLRCGIDTGAGYLADHVIVDEAQDLHATHWQLLRSLVADGPNDLFIAEDSHQRIYGQPVVLHRLGINIRGGRSSRLTLNYRTTAQNLHFAVSILEGADYHDLEEGAESTAGYTSARLGPHPRLVECDSSAQELDAVVDQVARWLDKDEMSPGSIAVLTRGHKERDTVVRTLNQRGIAAQVLDDDPATPDHVQVLTMHRAKGMEFRCVILAGVDHEHVPLQTVLRNVPEEEQAEAHQRERSLLYVAASRARDQLVVTWSGQRSTLLR